VRWVVLLVDRMQVMDKGVVALAVQVRLPRLRSIDTSGFALLRSQLLRWLGVEPSVVCQQALPANVRVTVYRSQPCHWSPSPCACSTPAASAC
jgi:hypothetical protein